MALRQTPSTATSPTRIDRRRSSSRSPVPPGLPPRRIVADHLDYLHHEAFFVVSTTFEVTAYRTLWFGLQYESETVKQGRRSGMARARDGALVRRRAGRRRPPAGAVRGLQRCRRRHARQRRLHTVDGETVSEAEARRAGRRPTELRIPTGESPFEKASLNRS